MYIGLLGKVIGPLDVEGNPKSSRLISLTLGYVAVLQKTDSFKDVNRHCLIVRSES